MVLVIGYGNPTRGDDGFGWHVAGRLDLPCCQVLTCHQLTPELAEPLSRADLAIFIDAAWRGLSGCRLDTRVEPSKSRDKSRLGRHECPRHNAFTHHVSVEDLLSLAHALYGASPEAYLITAAAESFEYGEKLSPEVEGVVDAAVKLVGQLSMDYPKGLDHKGEMES